MARERANEGSGEQTEWSATSTATLPCRGSARVSKGRAEVGAGIPSAEARWHSLKARVALRARA
eukprot:1723287-Pleurochrysis_carterae.AAC.2